MHFWLPCLLLRPFLQLAVLSYWLTQEWMDEIKPFTCVHLMFV